MNKGSTVVGLDVHRETVVAAVLPPGADRARATVLVVDGNDLQPVSLTLDLPFDPP